MKLLMTAAFIPRQIAVRKCGPELLLRNSSGELLASEQEAVKRAIQILREGKIVAMKNTGGYQLLVDATNDAAVRRLRLLKQRASKPFALLMPNRCPHSAPSQICVLLQKRFDFPGSAHCLIKKKGWA